MAGGTSLKEMFSKPKVQWAIVIFLIVIFLAVIFFSISALRGGRNQQATVVIGTPNETVDAILTGTAYATSHYFPATRTVTTTPTLVPTATVTITPTVTQTKVPSATIFYTQTRTPTRTKTATARPTSTTVRTRTKTPTITQTPTTYGKLSISKLPASQTIGSGGTATFNITITNTGPALITNLVVNDAKAPDCNRTISSLAIGASTSYSCTKTGVTANFSNFISVMGRNPSGKDVWANATATVTVTTASAHLSLAKTVFPTTFNTLGQVLNYTFVATNDGNVPLTNVTISDPKLTGFGCTPAQPAVLAVSATLSCTATHNVTQADLDSGSFADTATASGTPPSGPAVTGVVTNTATAIQNPAVSLAKDVSTSTYSTVGQSLDYTITATNSGNVTLTNVAITDPTLGALTCTQPVTLAPAATLSCTASHLVTQTDLDSGSYANTASVSGTPPVGSAVTNTANRTVTAVQNPALSLVKAMTGSPYSTLGGALDYTLTATNTGNVTLTSVSISDAKLGALTCSQPVTLAPLATLVCTASHTIDQNDLDYGSYYNTASVSGTPPTGPVVTASDSKTAVAATRPDRIAVSVDTDTDGEHEIVMMNPAGSGQVTINLSGTDMHLGGWSPLGDWLVYDTGATGHIYKVRPDGSYNSLIPNLPTGINSQPAWSPDGNWIIFVNNSGSQTDLYMIHPDGSSQTRLTNDVIIESDPSWMTSDKVVFIGDSGVSGNNEIYTLVTNPLGSPAQLVIFTGTGLNASPFLSPAGTTLVFARNDSGDPGWDIWTAGSGGSSPAVATGSLNTANDEKMPSWSRDGTNILFISDRTVSGTFQLYYGTSSSVTQITDGFSNEINLRWMP